MKPGAVRVAVWGVGPHASRKILPAIAACSTTQLAGLTTRNNEVAQHEADRHGCRVFSSPEEMLAASDVDVVYLATPVGVHYAQGRQVLLAGKHLWCEKSLTTRVRDTDNLANLSRDRRVALCEAFMFPYHPQFVRLRQLLAGDEIGALVSISCRFGMEIQSRPGYRHTAALGGGALFDLACYPLSVALRLGEGEPRVRDHRTHRTDAYEVDMAGDALLEFPSGALAFLEWGFGRGYANEVTVWAERGSVRAPMVFSKPEGFAASLERYDVIGKRHVETFEPTNSYVRMLEEFSRATQSTKLQDELRAEAQRQARHLETLAS